MIVGLQQDVPLCDVISMFKPAYKLIKLRIKLIKEIKMPRATRYRKLARVTLVTIDRRVKYEFQNYEEAL